MEFLSTRGGAPCPDAAHAIVKGLSDNGGLFVPKTFPNIADFIPKMLDMDYAERAAFVIGQYLEEYDKSALLSACKKAYAKFEDKDPAPVLKLDDRTFILELFHGPTLAFKDIALTILPYLLRTGADIIGTKEHILVLVATSGDTGKAALEGFKDQDGIKINVFYPSDGVSDMQKLQMCTQEGKNVNVVSVNGNFDDCQTAVKKIFSDKNINAELKNKNVVLSSANSINFGRLVPQIAYYFSAYCDLVNAEEIKLWKKVDFTVPSGNFGNILAGYYAKQMGLPIGKLVCASNSNNVLTEFFMNGTYDANREFFKTMSPSMDILISSNLERLVFELSGRNADITKNRMSELKISGKYSIDKSETEKLEKDFFADFCDEDECLNSIERTFNDFGYLADPHTAVALKAAASYYAYGNSENKMVVLSTASPYKFTQSVLKAINGKAIKDPFKSAKLLEEETAAPVPPQISDLNKKTIRFNSVIDSEQTAKTVLDFATR